MSKLFIRLVITFPIFIIYLIKTIYWPLLSFHSSTIFSI